jgi:methyl halide transferase
LTSWRIKLFPYLFPAAYEAEYLSENGFTNIHLLDVSLHLIEKIRPKFQDSKSIHIHYQNFFEHEAEYDLILEQTFFCAIHPSLRINYVKKMHKLLQPKGKLVGVLFDRYFASNPPFGGSQAEYESIFKDHFDFHTLEKCYNSTPPRAGNELFINFLRK